ncbi:WhiB family transcriptional regulator [Rhodococcus sp. 14-2470-1a]|uniref:WhiB family transcriptional regulator n=1 Tax=Rhodococcus sp. 14-2470-1a TaxID=2023150 RepID=UPI000B9A3A33|nr:hypothetical protein CH292_24590 [Rhodococcus sp. 14-2470-1a]
MSRDEVAEIDKGRGRKLIGIKQQVVTPRPSSLLKDQGRGGRAYLPRPGRGRDEVGTRGRGRSSQRPGGQDQPGSAPDPAISRTADYSLNEDWRSRAACHGRHAIFDPAGDNEVRASVVARHEQAIRICGLCPVLTECRAWIRSSPRRYRQGVVAGHEYFFTTSKEQDENDD